MPISEGKDGRDELSFFCSKLSHKTQRKGKDGWCLSFLSGQNVRTILKWGDLFIHKEWCWQDILWVIKAFEKLYQCRTNVLLSFFWLSRKSNLSASALDRLACLFVIALAWRVSSHKHYITELHFFCLNSYNKSTKRNKIRLRFFCITLFIG